MFQIIKKYVNSKRSSKENIGLLLDEAGHLKNDDNEKAESVFSSNDRPCPMRWWVMTMEAATFCSGIPKL